MSNQMTLPLSGKTPSPSSEGMGPPSRGPGGPPPVRPQPIEPVALLEAARTRYLNYAMSVITSRALPDVRDGLKPVQRRILFAMLHNLHLTPEGRYRKSAAVVGEVMAKYHPHGDQSIYDAMVRMAQDFSLRCPLVDGNGNFGSLDGDPPAAMRYTEAKLRPLAVRLLDELKAKTVSFRQNYDGTLFEPVVLPAQFPNLLVNGTTGIAVGMATNIPPHNLSEVVDATVALIDEPELSTPELCGLLPGPDFPMGGTICTPPEELIKLYEEGDGPVKVRAGYELEQDKKSTRIVVTSLPYAVNKAQLVEAIADHISAQKIPQLLDVRDESTDKIRVVLELKKGAIPELAMAYLYKHTTLESTFHVNMTGLVPTENPEVGAPMRLNLRALLRHFLDFRMEVVTRRIEFELEGVRKRIHILEGFERIFDELDDAIRLIRSSDGRADAAIKLIQRFFLDEVQADAILETKLYRLAKLEIEGIREELAQLREEYDRLFALLCDASARWELVRGELLAIKDTYGEPRRTLIGGQVAGLTFDPTAYIVAEETIVIVTRDGWIKRQKSFSDLASIRVREGDSVGWVFASTTPQTVAFFTNLGFAYVLKVDEIPATSGYGEPVQRHFDFADREKVVGVVSFDPRCLPTPVSSDSLAPPPTLFSSSGVGSQEEPSEEPSSPEETSTDSTGAESLGAESLGAESLGAESLGAEASSLEVASLEASSAETSSAEDSAEDDSSDLEDGVLAVAITRLGKGLRFPLEAHRERSTKNGRRYARLVGKADEDGVLGVVPCAGDELVSLATEGAKALLFPVSELKILRGSGMGVTAIKLQGQDHVAGFTLARGLEEGLGVETSRGRKVYVNARTYTPARRGGVGKVIAQKVTLTLLPQDPVVMTSREGESS